MMSSGADASDGYAALALLSGPELVVHLRVTCRRADYDAATRVLGDRDRRHAQTKAALAETQTGLANLAAEVEALEERYLQLKAAPSSRSSGGAIAAAAPRIHPPDTWTALALLPTCPAPALDLPPVCFDWENPAAAMVLPGSSGSADSNWRRDGQGGDYKVAKKCFDSLVRDAAWTCDEQEDDYKAAMKCFDSLVRDATRICFVWSYDAIPLTRQSDDPPPT